MLADREVPADVANPLGLDGIEFIEYATSKPQALGQLLETMGFRPISRHRSREVLLYRQGDMNIIVNAHVDAHLSANLGAGIGNPQNGLQSAETPTITAICFRVRDARAAYHRALERGAWAVPARAEVMELNIPSIHGVGVSRIYFVDRYQDFSIYDVDFTMIPTIDPHPPALGGMHWFGVVQYIGEGRTGDWTEFYRELFGFEALPDEQRFGILPKGRVLKSPCQCFYLQLIAPNPELDGDHEEMLQRVAFGTPDVLAAVALLRQRGVAFVESSGVHTEQHGALTQARLGGVMFELVLHSTG
ncbi:MAG: 4-hydroxyphenylpyruvate dioxygenase [Betaproteobacteria bacterium]|nr:4-hydroxyphenylpyruvate dioxygenase [Betaproteobacteria bacterium]